MKLIEQLEQELKDNEWRWEHLEDRRKLYGETEDYFSRKQSLQSYEASIKYKIELIKNHNRVVEVKNKPTFLDEDDYRDNEENWSDFSYLVRGGNKN